MRSVRIAGARPTLLVVDDDFDLRESLVDTLEDEGFNVKWARDGADALAELEAISIVRAILLDLNMPGVDGRSLRAALLADPERAAIPIIVLSGAEDWQEAARTLGAAAAFRKPFAVDQLLAALRELPT